jgi:phage tail protein X
MADIITARQGDMLDELAWRERGLGPADMPALLTLNPGVADLGPVLPLGTAVVVPAPPQAPTIATRDIVQLWS